MTKLALGAILFFVWFFFLALVVDTGKDENVAVWFLGYLAIIGLFIEKTNNSKNLPFYILAYLLGNVNLQ